MRSHWVVSPEQLLMVFTQPAKPGGSGSRARKSMYCWRTKKFVLSIGFGPFTVSLSTIVTVALDGAASAAPEAPIRTSVKVSFPSAHEASTMATEKVFRESLPAAH